MSADGARAAIREARRCESSPDAWAIGAATIAVAEATLALAEEQRTANLIRLWEAEGAFDSDWPYGQGHGEALDKIKGRLT